MSATQTMTANGHADSIGCIPLSKPNRSLLEQLNDVLCVDCDTMDAEFVATLPIRCHDMTSNQGFVHQALMAPNNKDLVEKTVKETKGKDWEDVYPVITARLAKNVYPLISGRVLAQVSPSHAYDYEYIVDHARRYAKAFNAEGIPNDRICIKIPVTSAGIKAAQTLKKEGIDSLGTVLFSVHQAIAASQAGMYAVSMYLNEFLAHVDPKNWPDVADPATQHPMAARHVQIRQVFDKMEKDTGKPQPHMKTASFVNCREVLAMPELGADHVTIGVPILSDLMSHSQLPAHTKGAYKTSFKEQKEAAKEQFIWDDWSPPRSKSERKRMEALANSDPLDLREDWKLASTDVDYTAEGVVDAYNEKDEVTRLRLSFALERFSAVEKESQVEIERLQRELNGV